MTYKATIYFDTVEDSYTEGQLPDSSGTNWVEELEANTKEDLKQEICEHTYTEWGYISHEDINEYDTASEYWTSYLANAENIGNASEREIAAWRKGELRLWAVNCHILVSEVTERKVTL